MSGKAIAQSRTPPFSPPVEALEGSEDDSAADLPISMFATDIRLQKPFVEIMLSLPTIFRTGKRILMVKDDFETFLEMDLDVSRLNKIHWYLWMAGRPLNARPLQRQKMMGFDIILTEQADLHLLKFSNRLLIKPLPEYILNFEFWDKYLCTSKELHESACGLLLSYVWLICSPLDMKMAHKLDLLPSYVTWERWKAFVPDFLSHVDVNALHQVNKRYHFGELRLERINTIYRLRFFFTHFIRGYLYGYNRYAVFFQRNFAWILVIFVYFSLVLSAMQVGLAVPPLNSNQAFQKTAYGFAVFAIFLVAFFLGLLGAIFASTFLFNMVAAILHDRRERLKKEHFTQGRDDMNKDELF